MFDSIWKIENIPQCEMKNADDVVNSLLALRDEECDHESFLNPCIANLTDPLLIPDMDLATTRILNASESGEHVVVFGDYDADGVTATAILTHFFAHMLEIDVEPMLPSRFEGGYGLSKQAIDIMAEHGTTLLVTCDTGVKAFDEIEYAKSIGIDVVVTDHHKCDDKLPECTAVVNPMRDDSEFPTRQLCGAGVAFKLVESISLVIGIEEYLEYMPIAAIGTIGDAMPLQGENRIIVKCGLELMKQSIFPGLAAITEYIAGKTNSSANATDFAFKLVPLINAAGRVKTADIALSLFLSEDDAEAKSILVKLQNLNEERKKIEAEIQNDVMSEKCVLAKDNGVIISYGENWSHGVVGHLSGMIADKYQKPTILLAGRDEDIDNPGTYLIRGSCRSLEGIDIHDILCECSDLLVRFGGHSAAAGLTLKEENLAEFVSRVENSRVLAESAKRPVITRKADFYLPPELISLKTAEALLKMEPFGVGNEEPVFVSCGFEEIFTARLGSDKNTLRLTFKGERLPLREEIKGIAFKSGSFENMVKTSASIAVMYKMKINEWNGSRSVSLEIIDILDCAECKSLFVKKPEMLYTTEVGYFSEIIGNVFSFTRDELADLFRLYRSFKCDFGFDNLYETKVKLESQGKSFSWFKIRYSIEIFIELGYIKRTQNGKFGFAEQTGGNEDKKQLTDSTLFSYLKRG